MNTFFAAAFLISTLLGITPGFAAGVAYAAVGDETCYQVTPLKDSWRSPDEFCMTQSNFDTYMFTMRTKADDELDEVAKFKFKKISEGRSYNTNQSEYGILKPSTTIFNAFSIRFMGSRDPVTKQEEGSVMLGSMRLFYRTKPLATPESGRFSK